MWPFRHKKAEERSFSIDEFLSLAGIPNSRSGEYVSPITAEGLPAVINAVTVISEAVATMPCFLYRVHNDKGMESREWLSNHVVDYLLNEKPNDCQTPFQFKRTLMRHCLLNGNAYALITWGKDGQPASLHPYPPSVMVNKFCRRSKRHFLVHDIFDVALNNQSLNGVDNNCKTEYNFQLHRQQIDDS
ncbi:Phage portal protein [Arsenophonus nasoniae]|uniref:Phage portal protein n=1 Tax=Arsenophonus nasoniae TaxID=638 RepID=A0A4P7KXA9_9GAMM|nr:Phage portal protein [Arsenophonus nasoniae]